MHTERRTEKLKRMDEWRSLSFHLLGALLFGAGIVLAGVGFETARWRERPAEIALLLGLTRAPYPTAARGMPASSSPPGPM